MMAGSRGIIPVLTDEIRQRSATVPVIDGVASAAITGREVKDDLVFLLMMVVVFAGIEGHAAIIKIKIDAFSKQPYLFRAQDRHQPSPLCREDERRLDGIWKIRLENEGVVMLLTATSASNIGDAIRELVAHFSSSQSE